MLPCGFLLTIFFDKLYVRFLEVKYGTQNDVYDAIALRQCGYTKLKSWVGAGFSALLRSSRVVDVMKKDGAAH